MVEQIRAALRSMWTDTCTVYENKPILNPNKTTTHKEVAVIVDEPCRLSFSSLSHAIQTETAAQTPQMVKLFIDENLKIKAGSTIVVKRRNKEFAYAHSGGAGIFHNHQEIVLIPKKGGVGYGEGEFSGV